MHLSKQRNHGWKHCDVHHEVHLINGFESFSVMTCDDEIDLRNSPSKSTDEKSTIWNWNQNSGKNSPFPTKLYKLNF